MTTLFISDCHLTAERPGPLGEFMALMAGPARYMTAVYILGDLFDLWLGDDDDAPGHAEVIRGLREATATGTPVFVMRGNHDFLLGPEFISRTGCRMLDDPTETAVEGRQLLLMHGDTLCTDDPEYQEFRRWTRSAEFIVDFLAKPLAERQRLASDIRARSLAAVAAKPMVAMDATESAVEDAFRDHAADYMIHGHTHRPAVHRHLVDGRRTTRIVLDDWYQGGSGLLWEEAGFRPVTIAQLLANDP